MVLSPIDYAIIIIYLVGVLTLGFYIGRKMKSGDDYFLAGRSLPWWAIGMSLVVTDIGATDMVGIAGSAYLYGIVLGNFDWLGSVPVMIIGAFLFIPMFWRARVTTIPEWLGQRYNLSVRTVVALIWGVVMSISLGITLYVTALAFNMIMGITPQVLVVAEDSAVFDQVVDATDEAKNYEFALLSSVEEANERIQLLGNPNLILVHSDAFDPTLILSPEDSPVRSFDAAEITPEWGLAIMEDARQPNWSIMASVILMGLIIGAYTLLGGLKAVVYTDVIQCAVMMGGTFFILIYGIYHLGGVTEFRETVMDLGEKTMYHFDLVIPADHEYEGEGTQFPWSGIFLGLGMVLANAYWMTNQTIVQRTLGARSEADAKASYIFGSLLKAFIPFLMVVPGIIALAHNPNIVNADTASSILVRDIMPTGFIGLFFAAFLAGLMSSVDSALNSAATIWTKDIYQPYFKPDGDPHHFLVVGRIVTVIFLFTAMICANFADGFDSIYTLIQTIFGLFQGPVLAIVVLGVLWKRSTAMGALVGLLSGVSFSVLLNVIQIYASDDNKLFHTADPFLYIAWWSFVASILITIIVSLLTKPKTDEELEGLVYKRGVKSDNTENANG